MPIEEGGGATGGFYKSSTEGFGSKGYTYEPPAQSPSQDGGGGGGAASAYPARPVGFGGPMTGWTGSELDAFYRRAPGAGLETNATQTCTTSFATITFGTLRYNDGVVIPDSSGASFKIPDSLSGHTLAVIGEAEWDQVSSGGRELQVLETLKSGVQRSRSVADITPGNGGPSAVAFSFPVDVGQGTTAIDLFDLQMKAYGAIVSLGLVSANMIIFQVR